MENKSFEQALTRIEEIVALLEAGNLPLDDSLRLFREAAELAEICKKNLDSAQLQVAEFSAGGANAEVLQ